MSTDRAPVPSHSLPIGFLLVLVVAVFLYVGMVACLGDVHNPNNDAFGRGLAAAFGALLGLIVWILLGVLLLIGWVKGEMPRPAATAAFILLPLSAIAAAIAIDPAPDWPWWLPLVPFMLPPPLAAFAIWARFPALHRALAPNPTSAVLLGIVLALTIAPIPSYVTDQMRRAGDARRAEAVRQAEKSAEEARQAENLSRFQKLTPDSPLWEWALFIGKSSELDADAVAGAKALTHRQSDAEEALRRGFGFPLVIYDRVDLAASPAFCAASTDFLRRNATAHPASKVDGEFRAAENDFDPYLEGIEWLTQKKCDLDDAIARTRETVSGYKQTASRDAFLAVLAWRHGNGFYNSHDNNRAIAEYDAALRLSPDNSQFYDSRGNAFYEQARYDQAIVDYTEAIRLNDGYSAAWDSRGNAYYFKGDNEQALRDYDAAIQRNPGKANAYNNRGNVYVGTGQFDRALQDYDKALQLEPKFRVALGNRGRTRFFQAAYAPAVEDFVAELALKPDDPYGMLWLYLARVRAGQPAQDGLRDAAGRLDRAALPFPVVAAYLGDTDRAAVLTDTRKGGDPDRKGRECEADFYLGAKAAAESDAASAHELLQQAAAICPTDFIELTASKYELARLP